MLSGSHFMALAAPLPGMPDQERRGAPPGLDGSGEWDGRGKSNAGEECFKTVNLMRETDENST